MELCLIVLKLDVCSCSISELLLHEFVKVKVLWMKRCQKKDFDGPEWYPTRDDISHASDEYRHSEFLSSRNSEKTS